MDILKKVIDICNRKDCTNCIHEMENDRYPRVLNYCIWCDNGSEYQADYEKVIKLAEEEIKWN